MNKKGGGSYGGVLRGGSKNVPTTDRNSLEAVATVSRAYAVSIVLWSSEVGSNANPTTPTNRRTFNNGGWKEGKKLHGLFGARLVHISHCTSNERANKQQEEHGPLLRVSENALRPKNALLVFCRIMGALASVLKNPDDEEKMMKLFKSYDKDDSGKVSFRLFFFSFPLLPFLKPHSSTGLNSRRSPKI